MIFTKVVAPEPTKVSKLVWLISNRWRHWELFKMNYRMHTYIHNWPLHPFSQDFGLASHITHVVCVNFIRDRRTYSLTSTPNYKFLRNFFHGSFILLSELLSKICWEEAAEEIFFLFQFLKTNLGYEPRLLSLISRHTTY